MTVSPIPEGYDAPIPYLSCRDAAAALEFYKKAFGATELMRLQQPDGRIGHAEIQIGGGKVMLADEFPEMGFVGPHSLGGSCVGIHVFVEDVDGLVERAAGAGARVVRPPADQFYGDRSATIEDPSGHRWFFATHKENLTSEQIAERARALAK
jgi:PhnB protein